MELKQQVTNLEISKRLKELGAGYDSVFYWSVPNPDKAKNEKEKLLLSKFCEVMLCKRQSDWGEAFDVIPAYSVPELGEILPNNFDTSKVTNTLVARDKGKFVVYYEFHNGGYNKCYADTEADARGKMLIYLLENNLLT